MGDRHQIHYEDAKKRIDVRSSGELESNDCRAMIAGLGETCAVSPVETILIDHTDGSLQHLKHGEMRSIAQACVKLNESFSNGRFALVVTHEVDFGLARMWMSLTEGNLTYERQIFRTREDAVAWFESDSTD